LTFKERIEEGLAAFKDVPDGIENELKSIADSLAKLEGIRKLNALEANEKQQIDYYLKNKKFKDETPVVKMTLPELKGVLHGTDASATKDTYHLDD